MLSRPRWRAVVLALALVSPVRAATLSAQETAPPTTHDDRPLRRRGGGRRLRHAAQHDARISLGVARARLGEGRIASRSPRTCRGAGHPAGAPAEDGPRPQALGRPRRAQQRARGRGERRPDARPRPGRQHRAARRKLGEGAARAPPRRPGSRSGRSRAARCSRSPRSGTPSATDRSPRVLPEPFFDIRFLDVQLWQWIALVLLLLASIGLAWLLTAPLLRLVRAIARRTGSHIDDVVAKLIVGPLRLALGTAVFLAGLYPIWLAVRPHRVVSAVTEALLMIAFTWFMLRLIDSVARVTVSRSMTRGHVGGGLGGSAGAAHAQGLRRAARVRSRSSRTSASTPRASSPASASAASRSRSRPRSRSRTSSAACRWSPTSRCASATSASSARSRARWRTSACARRACGHSTGRWSRSPTPTSPPCRSRTSPRATASASRRPSGSATRPRRTRCAGCWSS